MKRMIGVVLAMILTIGLMDTPIYASEEYETIPYLIVYSIDSDEVVIEKNADETLYPASITKVLTALVAYDAISDLNEKVVISEEDLAGLSIRGASVVGLEVGHTVSYSDLLYSLIVISAGDSAQTLANHLFGSEEAAAQAMNKKAKELGMISSHFVNVTGLHDDDHYTTARDILFLMQEASRNETIRTMMSTMKYSISVDEEASQIVFMHTIQMAKTMNEIIEHHITGGKTGFTDEAGSNLASFGEANGINYLVIVSGVDPTEDTFAAVNKNVEIYEYLDHKYQIYELWDTGHDIAQLKILHSAQREYTLVSQNKVSRLIDKDIDLSQIEQVVHLNQSYEAPMKKGEPIGRVDIVHEGETVASYELLMDSDISYENWVVVIETLYKYWPAVLLFVLAIFSGVYFQVRKIKERNKTRYRL